jgi:hypothetical protein
MAQLSGYCPESNKERDERLEREKIYGKPPAKTETKPKGSR